jgi:hypothetical protein
MFRIIWAFLITHPRFHPMLLMTIDFLSALFYLLNKDYRRAIYWLAAGVLTATVTL